MIKNIIDGVLTFLDKYFITILFLSIILGMFGWAGYVIWTDQTN